MRGRPARNGLHDISLPASVPDEADVARVLDHADLIVRGLEIRLASQRESYATGYGRGFRDGYERAAAELEDAWREVADRVARGGLPHAELESRRWGPGGRERFADPRPGDYCGRGGAA